MTPAHRLAREPGRLRRLIKEVVRTLPAGQYPVAVAAGPAQGPVYVANEVSATVNVGNSPYGVAADT